MGCIRKADSPGPAPRCQHDTLSNPARKYRLLIFTTSRPSLNEIYEPATLHSPNTNERETDKISTVNRFHGHKIVEETEVGVSGLCL
jgi:hypothetical protein